MFTDHIYYTILQKLKCDLNRNIKLKNGKRVTKAHADRVWDLYPQVRAPEQQMLLFTFARTLSSLRLEVVQVILPPTTKNIAIGKPMAIFFCVFLTK